MADQGSAWSTIKPVKCQDAIETPGEDALPVSCQRVRAMAVTGRAAAFDGAYTGTAAVHVEAVGIVVRSPLFSSEPHLTCLGLGPAGHARGQAPRQADEACELKLVFEWPKIIL